ncbi:hypothetical protein PSPO01_05067 [Paraphaeosphaeria sporulosa]
MPKYVRPYFDHREWVRDGITLGDFESVCNFKHPIDRYDLRQVGPHLVQMASQLVECASLVCPAPMCEAGRGPKFRRRVMETIRRIHEIADDIDIVVPVRIVTGMVGIIGAGNSSSRTVVRTVLPQELSRRVVEERIYQPAPIHETETKTWVHRAHGSKYLARVETKTYDRSQPEVEEVSRDENRGHKRGKKKKSQRRMIKERGESSDEEKGKRRRSRDRGHERHRSKSRDRERGRRSGKDTYKDRDDDRRRSRSRSRDREHERHMSRDRRRIKDRSSSRDRHKEQNRRKSNDCSRHECSKDKDKCRKKHERRPRSRERSRRRDDRDKHKYDESEREYDSSPSRRSSSSSSSASRSNSRRMGATMGCVLWPEARFQCYVYGDFESERT